MLESDAILRLQDIDLELLRLKTSLERMPQHAKLATIDTADKKLSVQLRKILGQKKDLELELAENKAQQQELEKEVTKTQSRIHTDGSDSYRIAQSLEMQLTDIAKQMEKLRYDQAHITEKLTQATKAYTNALHIQDKLKQQREEQVKTYDAKTQDVKAQARVLQAEKQELQQYISADLLACYQKNIERFGGNVVEVLHGNKPSACRVALQPSQYSDVKRGPAITTCPYCHRILICDHDFNHKDN